ncbi:MAG: serine/threonine protein kinase [Kofleriaceae bacterium]|nr:serine/threonine protein kinase [Kofleriaceae bacterium]
MIQPGQVVDKYELLERVGQGGMSVVYRALDRSLKRSVAIKVLHRHLADSDEARDRFEREAHAVAKLRHENILEIFAYSGRGSDDSYIVTEYIDGATLKQFVADHPIVHPEIAAMITLQVGRALGHAHAAGILHRDVKPENVMIRSDGVIKLMDFGISQMVDLGRLTVTGQLLGSPAYMSPEHVEGQPLDFRTDVFATGVVLYHLAVGKLPFEGKNPHEVLKRVAECRYVDPRQANPRVGNALGKIILRAMAREPADRYQHITEMVSALERFVTESGLGPARDELARYFADPGSYQAALGQRLVDHLTRLGQQTLRTDRIAALEAFDRVLTIDAKNATVLTALDAMGRRRRWLQGAVGAALLVTIAGGAYAVRRRAEAPPVATAPGALPVARADGEPIRVPLWAVVPDQLRGSAGLDASLAQAATDADPGGVIGDVRPDAGAGSSGGDEPNGRPRPDARLAVDAAPAPAARVTLVVSPSNSTVQLAGGVGRVLAGGRAEVEVPAGGLEVTVTNEACCEAERRTLGVDDGGRTVVVNLAFRPGQVVARCAVPGVAVRIEGRPRQIDGPATIPFGNTTQSRRTVEVEFVGPAGIDRQKVTVAAGQTMEVTCAL